MNKNALISVLLILTIGTSKYIENDLMWWAIVIGFVVLADFFVASRIQNYHNNFLVDPITSIENRVKELERKNK